MQNACRFTKHDLLIKHIIKNGKKTSFSMKKQCIDIFEVSLVKVDSHFGLDFLFGVQINITVSHLPVVPHD